MPRNRAARRRAARAARGRAATGPRNPAPPTVRLLAGAAGLIIVVLVLVVLARTAAGRGNPGRAVRGLAIVLGVGVLLLWWAIHG